LYLNVQHAREMRPLPAERWAREGIEWLCFKGLSAIDNKNYNPYLKCRDIKSAIAIVNEIVPGALMGCYIIRDILDCEPLSFCFTGIDFFSTKKKTFEINNYREYLDGYLPPRIIEQGNKINVGKKEDGHNVLSNTRYIYNEWISGNIIMPEYISTIIQGIIDGSIIQHE